MSFKIYNYSLLPDRPSEGRRELENAQGTLITGEELVDNEKLFSEQRGSDADGNFSGISQAF